jgi:membrane fusion protein, heavy metal efflux system
METQVNNRLNRLARVLRIGRRGTAALVLTWAVACSPGEDAGEGGEEEETHVEGFVEMDEAAMTNVGLEIVPVTVVSEAVLSATGTIIYNENRTSFVGPRAEGRIVSIDTDLGRRVRAGDPLAGLESPELGEAEAAHEQARAELELARENYDRELSLFEDGISSRKDMSEARAEFRSKEAAFRAATARHRTLGASDHPEDNASLGGMYTLSAPISGTVVERDLVLGEIVGVEDDVFTIADLTKLWIVLDIYDRDLSRVRAGMAVDIATTAFQGETFSGTLTYVGQVVDPITRTVKARVEIDNPDRTLRPGMFATALIHGLDADAALAIPDEAIQELDEGTVVFVPVGSGRFEIRPIIVGSGVGNGLVTILDGLIEGEQVVAQGSFYLKSELLKESFGGDEH